MFFETYNFALKAITFLKDENLQQLWREKFDNFETHKQLKEFIDAQGGRKTEEEEEEN